MDITLHNEDDIFLLKMLICLMRKYYANLLHILLKIVINAWLPGLILLDIPNPYSRDA